MKNIIKITSVLLFITCASLLLHPAHTKAAFNANNLIDDFVFNDAGSMGAAQIDAFLNSFPASCISQNNGFAARIPMGYSSSSGFTFGPFVSAGQVIASAAEVYSVNPRVLLATLEKEQSLVTGQNNFSGFCNNGDENKYTAAMGYGCPDSGTVHSWTGVSLYMRNGVEHTSTGSTCVNTAAKSGFSQQVIRAAWLLKFGQQRSQGNTGWAVVNGNWDNSDDPSTCYGGPMTQGTWKRCSTDANAVFYDGYITIDGTATHMDTGATAALYWYTPHFHGNQNFVALYEGWFGSTHSLDYSAQPVWQGVYTDNTKTSLMGWNATLIPGQNAWAVVMIKNTGNVTWTQAGGNAPVRLATYGPWGRVSNFCAGLWIPTSPNCTRPANLKGNSTGGTTVAPGEVGVFEFPINAPTGTGVYSEHFGLVEDGVTTFPNGFLNFQFNVTPLSFNAQPVWQGVYTDKTKTSSPTWNYSLTPGQNAWAVVVMKNNSNFTWTKGGQYDVRLATFNPWGRISNFCAGLWIYTVPNCTRPATFDEASVPPGSSGTFEFNLNAPTGIGTYNESFGLVADGKSTFHTGFNNIQLTVHH